VSLAPNIYAYKVCPQRNHSRLVNEDNWPTVSGVIFELFLERASGNTLEGGETFFHASRPNKSRLSGCRCRKQKTVSHTRLLRCRDWSPHLQKRGPYPTSAYAYCAGLLRHKSFRSNASHSPQLHQKEPQFKRAIHFP